MAWITAGIAAGNAIYGIIDATKRRREAKKGLEALAKEKPTYATMADAQAAVRKGFTEEQNALFRQQMASSTQQQYQQALQRNPNLASSMMAGLSGMQYQSLLQRGAQESDLVRSKQRDWLQRQDLETERRLREKYQKEQQFGAAYSEASADIANTIGALGYTAATMYGAYQGMSGGQTGGPFTGGGSKISEDQGDIYNIKNPKGRLKR